MRFSTRWLRTPLFLLVSLCLIARLALFLAARPWDATVESEVVLLSDAAGYHQLARNWVEHGRFGASPRTQETLRTPVYPAFVAAIYAVFGPQPWIVLLAQIGLAGLSCGLLYTSARRVVGPQCAALAAAFFALEPSLIFASLTLMSETLFVCLCVLALHCFVLAIERRFDATRLWPVAGAGLCFGLAAWVRPIALYLPAAIALFLWTSQRGAPRQALRSFAVFAAAFAAVLAPWAARNLAVGGAFSVSSSGAYNLLVLNVGPMEMERRGQPLSVVKPALLAEADALLRADGGTPELANGLEKAPYQRELARRYLRERPLAFAKFYAFGVFTSFANLGTRGYADLLGLRSARDDRFDLRAHPDPRELLRAALVHKSAAELWLGAALASFLLVFYPCVAAGVVSAFARAGRERELLWLCALVAAYFVAVTGVAGLARFKVAAAPFLCVLAGVGAAQLGALARRHARVFLLPRAPSPTRKRIA